MFNSSAFIKLKPKSCICILRKPSEATMKRVNLAEDMFQQTDQHFGLNNVILWYFVRYSSLNWVYLDPAIVLE